MTVRSPLVLGADGLPQALQSGVDRLEYGDYQPQQFGMFVASNDPNDASATRLAATGIITFSKAFAAAPKALGSTVTFFIAVATAGATLTANQNRLGLYKFNGTSYDLVCSTANEATTWATVGLKSSVSSALTAAIAVGDELLLAALTVGTVPPTFVAPAATNINIIGWGGAAVRPLRATLTATAQTTLPANVLITAITAAATGTLIGSA